MGPCRQVNEAGDLSNKSKSKGVGVGLPLSYNITNALGGELCFTSNPGDTKFYFSLPFLSSSAAAGGGGGGDPGGAEALYDSIPTMEATRVAFTVRNFFIQ